MQDKKPETSSITVKQISYGSAAYSLFALHYMWCNYHVFIISCSILYTFSWYIIDLKVIQKFPCFTTNIFKICIPSVYNFNRFFYPQLYFHKHFHKPKLPVKWYLTNWMLWTMITWHRVPCYTDRDPIQSPSHARQISSIMRQNDHVKHTSYNCLAIVWPQQSIREMKFWQNI
jgi:hypothetical protein